MPRIVTDSRDFQLYSSQYTPAVSVDGAGPVGASCAARRIRSRDRARSAAMGTTSDRPLGPRPPRKIGRGGAEHYSWGEGCDGLHFVRAPALSVILEQMPAGTSEVEHHHQVARQYFHMLEGETVMVVEGREI